MGVRERGEESGKGLGSGNGGSRKEGCQRGNELHNKIMKMRIVK